MEDLHRGPEPVIEGDLLAKTELKVALPERIDLR